MRQALRAIDLYSGIGGWSLGLRLANIEVVASYDNWGEANETNFINNQHQTHTVDIRRLPLEDLPSDIDLVVGSPPCTQFSYANRGGNGNLSDGFADITKFLQIVDFLRPKHWIMENVPRVAKLIHEEVREGGRLHSFSKLGLATQIVDMSEFGVPQRRKRCLVGNIDFEALLKVRRDCKKITLGEVLGSLAKTIVVDPTFGLRVHANQLADHSVERHLNSEELRINRASKVFHPIYNAMAFPDSLERPVRTITATCTRVSRESVIVEFPQDTKKFRRLTVRERACLQGFPISYQFYGSTYSKKLKMIGNAVPPSFSYLIGCMIADCKPVQVVDLKSIDPSSGHQLPESPCTPFDRPGRSYRTNRKFRFAITSLQLKSGVRYELVNDFSADETPIWKVNFWFGSAKNILSIELNQRIQKMAFTGLPLSLQPKVKEILNQLVQFLADADLQNLQRVWTHRGPGRTRPFMILDALISSADKLNKILEPFEAHSQSILENVLFENFLEKSTSLPGLQKLKSHSGLITSGLLIGSFANSVLASEDSPIIGAFKGKDFKPIAHR